MLANLTRFKQTLQVIDECFYFQENKILLGLINNALLLLECTFESLGSSVCVVTKQRIFSCSAQHPSGAHPTS